MFRRYGQAYRQQHGASLSTAQRRVMTAIERCHTAALGGHVEQCDSCGHQRISYNSCRNRHCPKCQSLAVPSGLMTDDPSSSPCRTSMSSLPCRKRSPPSTNGADVPDYRDQYQQLTDASLTECSACQRGHMVIIEELKPAKPSRPDSAITATTTIAGVTFDFGTGPHTFQPGVPSTPVPDPGTLALFGTALAAFGIIRRRKKAV